MVAAFCFQKQCSTVPVDRATKGQRVHGTPCCLCIARGDVLQGLPCQSWGYIFSITNSSYNARVFPSSQLHHLITGCENSGPNVPNDSPSAAPALEPPAIHNASGGVVQICFTLATSLSLLIIHSRAF